MRKKITKMTKTTLSLALAAAMVMGLSGMTAFAEDQYMESAEEVEEEIADTQTILVEELVNGTADISFDYHIYQITDAEKPIETMDDILDSVAGSNLDYVIYDAASGEELATETTDSDGGFSLSAKEYAEFVVAAETDWYVFQDTPDEYPLADEDGVTAEGDHASVVDNTNGVVQYESEEEPAPTTSVDKTALEAEIGKAEALDENDYTAESWEVLQEALENAKAVFEDPDATQEEVDEALDELEKAREDLEKKDDGSTPVPDTVNITGTKTWDDNDNQDGLRPENITVNLLADDEVVESVAVAESADGSWTYAFENVPANNSDGEKITYTVTEDAVDEYETAIDGYDITNSHTPVTGYITIEKVWDDNDNQDGVRPENVTVGLFAGKTYVDSKEITEADGWTCTFGDLPLYEDGEEIEYTAYEEDVEGYTGTLDWNEDSGVVTFTNSYTPEETSVTVRKVWNDAGDQDGLRPASVTVSLLADGQPALNEENESITGELNEDNDWSYDFTGLDKYAAGVEIAYTVTEDEVDDYTAEDPICIEGTNTFILVNTHEPALYNGDGNMTITKVWDDEDDSEGVRPDYIQVTVKANDEVVRQEYVTEAEDWTCTFTDLPQYADGQELTYTVEETLPASVPEGTYVSDITEEDGAFTITNTHAPLIDISVTKVWEDNNNQDGARPEDVTVSLLKDEVETGRTLTLSEDNQWTDTFEGVSEYEDGKKITYTVAEDPVAGYDATIEGDQDEGFTVTNTHVSGSVDVSVEKVWVDNDNEDETRPDEVTVHLWNTDTETHLDSATLSDANGWTYVWEDQPQYANGTEICYEVTEEAVEGYDAETVESTDADGCPVFTITNTYAFGATIDITGTKVWDDADDQDGLRPDHVTVELLADGDPALDEEGDPITMNVTPYTTLALAAPSPIAGFLAAGDVNEWNFSFKDLPKYNGSGEKISYTFNELAVEGYESTVITGDMTEGFTITNTHTPATIDITGTKNWDDEDNQDDLRPSVVVVYLTIDGERVVDGTGNYESAVLTEGGGWTYSFHNLDQCANGKAIDYGVEEESVKGYEATYTSSPEADGNYTINITNTRVKVAPAIEDVTITATGLDEDNTKSYDGKEVTLTVTAQTSPEGAETTYTWYKDGTVIDGATDAELILAGNISDSGTYTCVVTVTNDGIEATGSAEITITIHADYSDLDEEIVPDENDPSTWEETESVSAYSPVEIEMSTALPHMDGAELSAGGYSIVFHDELADGLTLDEKAAAFTVTIGGETIDSKYYTITLADGTNPLQIMPYAITLAAPAITDSCAFHVEVNLSALYQAGVISDDSLTGDTELMLFFYADLEGDALAGSYTSTAWYEVYSSESDEALFTSPQHVVTITTYEIEITKYDASQSEEPVLAGATLGIYSDEACTNAVTLNGEAYTAITGEDGTAAFYGLAEGTYYIKEIKAPSGYSLSDAVLPVDLTSLDEGTYVYSGKFANVPIATYSVMTEYTNLTGTGATGENAATAGENYITTLTADEGYVLPESVEVTIGGNTASAGTDYEYSRETGELTIYGTSITGDIVITAAAAGPEAFAVYCATDTSLTFYMDTEVPNDGGTYKDKAATNVYTGLESLDVEDKTNNQSSIPWSAIVADVTNVVIDESFADARPINLTYWFYGFKNASFTGLANINTSNVTKMAYLFNKCSGITELDLSKWDTSNVTTMRSMFSECTALQTVDVSNFDTSNVASMYYMFYNCKALTEVDVSNFDTSNVTTMYYMFYYCSSLKELNVSNFDTSNVTTMYDMFEYCTSLEELDVSEWNTEKCTSLHAVFGYCSALTTLNVSAWNTANVTDMGSAFRNCKSLTSLDLGSWNTAKVANSSINYISDFATGCTALDWIKIGDAFDLFTKSEDALVSQQNWYDSDTNGNLMSDNYMIGVSNATSGNTSGQYWTHTTQVAEPAVKYAVKIWGIGADTYQDEDDGTIKTAGLTFGPATGDNEDSTGTGYITSYKAHLTQEEYESKEKGVCIHWMTWDEIIEQSKEDPDVFQDCLENGCTKAVELTPNEKLFNQTTVNNVLANNYSGDGVSTLYYLLNGTGSSSYTYGAIWNYSYASNSSSDPANIYSRSRIRTTLTGDRSNIDEWLTDNPGVNDYYGYDTLCDTSDCLLSCFPENLQEAMVPRTTSNTGNATSGTSANDKTSYDKLFLFSLKEIGISSSSDDAGGDDYGINSSASDRVAYEFSGIDAMASSSPYWWTRSRNVSTNGSAYGVYASGGFGYINVPRSYGLSPGFCLPGPEETEEMEAFAVYSADDYSLTFYYDVVPTEGDDYKDKTVTNVYPDLDTLDPSGTADIPWTDVREDVTSVVVDTSFKDAKPINLAGWFYGFKNASFSGFENLNTSEVKSMQYTFYDCEKLETLNVSDWDTSNLRSLHGTFDTCLSLTELDVSKWNTESLTTLYDTFADCSSLTTLDVSNWDTSNVTNMMYLFYDCTSLESLGDPGAGKLVTSSVTSLFATFYCCESLEKLDVSGWDTSNVTDMGYLFFNCTNLDGLEASNWNTSSLTSLYATFYECAKLTNLDVSKWDTSNLEDLSYTFYDCYVLTNLDVSGWNTENVTTLNSTFTDCDAFTSLDLSNWKTGKVTTLYQMFYGCEALTSVGDLSKWDTANVEDMHTTFYDCSSLAEVNVAGWNTEKVTVMDYTFRGCSALSNLDLSGWKTSNVTTYDYFAYLLGDDFDWIKIGDSFDLFAKSTSQLVSQQYWYDSDENGNLVSDNYMIGVTNASSGNESGQYWTRTTKTMPPEAFAVYSNTDKSLTFYYDAVPTEGDTYGGKVATNVYTGVDSLELTSEDGIPWNSVRTSITSVVFDESFASVQPKSLAYWFYHFEAATLFTGFENLDTSQVTSVKHTFNNCKSITSIDVSDFDTSSLTNMYGMFYNCTKLQRIDGLSGWDTSGVTDMGYLFYTTSGNSVLESVGDLSDWDTSSVTNMQYMFGGCETLESVSGLSNWDISSVKNISYMFANCKAMESIEGPSSWDTESVTSMAAVFTGCEKLEEIDLSKWDTSKATTVQALFQNCSALTSMGDISTWDTESVTDMRNVFSGCTSLETLDLSGWNTEKVTSNYSGFAIDCTALDWIKIGDDFDLFTKSEDALVSQKTWYDSDVNGKTISSNYMIGVSNANSGNTSGQYWTHTTQAAEPAVKYAVKIWGIGADTYQDEDDGTIKTAGLTFGPATGDNEDGTGTGYITTYKAHLTEDEYDSGEKGVCIHWMTWDEIIEQSEKDPDVFEECREEGCTKAVELTPNETLFNMTTVDNYVGNESYTGDGVSTLYYLLNGTGSVTYSNSATWNYSYEGNSSSDRANIYSRSRIRTTLTGDRSNIDEWLTDNPGVNDYYGYDTLCDTSNCLLSCFPENLQEAIVPRTTKNTGNATAGTSANDKTTYDKLFLFSVKETGLTNSSDDAGGDDYGINSDDSDRVAYEFSNADATDLVDRAWWSRSRYSSSSGMALYVRKSGSCANSYIDDAYGLSPGFCIE